MADDTRHVLSMRDFDLPAVWDVFSLADDLACSDPEDVRRLCAGRVMGTLFYQPSTRTRIGFEVAAHRLGMTSVGINDVGTSRMNPLTAETFEDTVRVLTEMVDCLVIRHHARSSSGDAARLSGPVPIINAGDGSGEHPTQALSDVRVMAKELGGLAGRHIGLVGDLNTRVMRSLVLCLVKLSVGKISYVSAMSMSEDLEAEIVGSGVALQVCDDVRDLLAEVDALEMMPPSIPSLDVRTDLAMAVTDEIPERFRVTRAKVEQTQSRAIILHPGPRSLELHPDVDSLPNSAYFEQVRQALTVRMAVLVLAQGAPRAPGVPARQI